MNRIILCILVLLLAFLFSCTRNQALKHQKADSEELLNLGFQYYKNPNNKSLAYDYVDALINHGHFSQALYLLENELSHSFEKDEAYYNRRFKAARGGKHFSKILDMEEDYLPLSRSKDTIISAMNTILELNKKIQKENSTKLRAERGEAFYSIQEWKAAEYDFSQVTEKPNMGFKPFYNLVMIKFVNRKYQDAYDMVLKERSDGFTVEEQQTIKNIQKVLADLVQIENNDLPTKEKHLQKAKILLSMKDYDLALKELSLALNEDNLYGDAYAMRAYVYFQVNDMNKALAAIEQAENITGKRNTPLSRMIRNKSGDSSD